MPSAGQPPREAWRQIVVAPLLPVRYPPFIRRRRDLWALSRFNSLITSRKLSIGRSPRGACQASSEFLIEAARRYAEDLELEDEIATEAEAGITDAEAGRYVTIATPDDAEALHERTMARLRERLAADRA